MHNKICHFPQQPVIDLVDFRLLVRKQSWEVKECAAVENHLRLLVGARHDVAKCTQRSSLVDKTTHSLQWRAP